MALVWFLFAISSYTLTTVFAQQPISLFVTGDFEQDQQEDQLHGFYVKDNKNGELRFFGNNGNFNNRVNQLITQQQDFLEQLRPQDQTTTPVVLNLANGAVTPVGTNGAIGTQGNLGAAGTNGNLPIVINLAGNGGGANGGAAAAGGGGNSAIAALLPQIISQSLFNRMVAGNRPRPTGNRRRRRRRPSVNVIRP